MSKTMMPPTDLTNLAPPPRRVPLLVRTQLLFEGTAWQILWLFLGMVLIGTTQAALPNVRGLRVRLFEPPIVTVTGTVQSVSEILPPPEVRAHPERWANHPKLYNYTFTYRTTGGRQISRQDFATGYQPRKGEPVTVTYRSENPEFGDGSFPGKEIQMGNVPAPEPVDPTQVRLRALMGLWPLAIPLCVGALLLFGISRGARRIALLKHGQLAIGHLIACLTAGGGEDSQTYYLLTFLFLGEDGRVYNFTERSETEHEWGSGDAPRAVILYHRADPHNAIALKNLPGADPFTLDNAGQLRARPDAGLGVLVLPMLVLAGCAYAAYLLIQAFLA